MTLRVGIASYEQMKARTLAVARGKRARKDDPKIWFTSMESFAKVLSDRNRALLALIAETQPDSLAELSELSGRAKSNLSRTLKTMERYGLVQLQQGAGRYDCPACSLLGHCLGRTSRRWYAVSLT